MFQGALWGFISATGGCLIFAITDQIIFIIRNYGFLSQDDINITPRILAITILGGLALSFFPSIVGGLVMGYWFKKLSIHKPVPLWKCVIIGNLIGLLVGYLMAIIYNILTGLRSDPDVFIIHSVQAMIIAALASGWTAWRIAKFLNKNKLAGR